LGIVGKLALRPQLFDAFPQPHQALPVKPGHISSKAAAGLRLIATLYAALAAALTQAQLLTQNPQGEGDQELVLLGGRRTVKEYIDTVKQPLDTTDGGIQVVKNLR